MEFADAATAFNERHDRTLVGSTAFLDERGAARCFGAGLLDIAVVGFIGFYDHTAAAKRASAERAFAAHGLADAMTHEPSRLVGNAKGAVHLMRRHALFGR